MADIALLPVEKLEERRIELQTLLETNISKIASALPDQYKGKEQEFISSLLRAANKTPEILQCTPQSIFNTFMQSVELGLRPNTGFHHASLLPFKDTKNSTYTLTLIVEYKGYIELIKRDPRVIDVYANIVYKDDTFEVEEGTSPKITHKLAMNGERLDKNIKAVYAVIVYRGNYSRFIVMGSEEVDKIQAKAKTQDIWNAYRAEMAKKTVIRRLAKYIFTEGGVVLRAMQFEDDPNSDYDANPEIGVTAIVPKAKEDVTSHILEQVK